MIIKQYKIRFLNLTKPSVYCISVKQLREWMNTQFYHIHNAV